MNDDERCSACPLNIFVKTLASEVAAQMCPKEPARQIEQLVSVTEAARRLGVHRSYIDRRRFELPFVKFRDKRGYDIVLSKLEAFIRER